MSLKIFPGFIDVHVHLREPGATHKEDFQTGSRAAVKGGFTFILDMPNNVTPTISPERLAEKIQLSQKAIIDIGFHYGTDGKNTETFEEVMDDRSIAPLGTYSEDRPRNMVYGLKIYCNHTTGTLLIEDQPVWEKIFKAWESKKPILIHAEGDRLPYLIALGKKYNRHLHVCHISQANEVMMVRRAKEQGIYISAGVTPHHLFLTDKDVEKLGAFGIMKPPLGTKNDQEALWKGLRDGTIDLIETDHAPHTKEEKNQTPTPFGVPGLETAATLMATAVIDKRVAEHDFVRLFYDNPQRIFAVPVQDDTYIEMDWETSYNIGDDGYETKCGWSPFDGWPVKAKVVKVVLRGKTLLEKGELL